MTSRYIAIDWGSTTFRAWLFQGDRCLESRQSEAGVTRLNGRSPAAVFSEITEGWRRGATPAVVGGMALLGHWLDQRLESAPWLLIVGALLGVGMATYELLKTVNAVEAREGRQDSKP